MERNQNRPRGLFQADQGETRGFVRYFKVKEFGVYTKKLLEFYSSAPKADRATPEPTQLRFHAHPCASDTSRIHGKSLPWAVPISQMEKNGKATHFSGSPEPEGWESAFQAPRLDPGGAGGRRAIKRRSCRSRDPSKTQRRRMPGAAPARRQSSSTGSGSGSSGNNWVGWAGGERPEPGAV